MMTTSLILAALTLSTVCASECPKFLDNLTRMTGRDPEVVQMTTRKESYSTTYRGMPRSAKWIKTDGTETFRHYVSNDFGLREIVENSLLRAGNMSYVVASPMIRDTYQDLTGIFITYPELAAKQVGVEGSLYVDFKLPAGRRILVIERDILLLPGQPYRSGDPRKQLIAIQSHARIDHELAVRDYRERNRIENERSLNRNR